MNWIKKSNLIKFCAAIVIIVLIYLGFLCLDFFAYYLHQNRDREASLVIAKRQCEEDYFLINEAKTKGFKSTIYPNLFDESPYRDIALQYRVAPLGSTPNTNLYYCNEGYGQVRYKSDQYGFRNISSAWKLPADLILIGDSFVQGACVPNDSTISNKLTNLKIRTLNLGTGSNSPIHYAALAKIFIPVKKSKNVGMIFFANDNIPGEENSIFYELFFKNAPNYFEPKSINGDIALSIELVSLYEEASKILDASSEHMDKNRLKKIEECSASMAKNNTYPQDLWIIFQDSLVLRNLRAILRGIANKWSEQSELTFGTKLAIDTLIQECKKTGCAPIFIYIPNSSYWSPEFHSQKYRHLLKIYLKSFNLELIDTTDKLNSLGREAYAVKGQHLSPLGYEIVSKEIKAALSK